MLLPISQEVSDYWDETEHMCAIAIKEALAIDNVLQAFLQHLVNARVDAAVDNPAVIKSWNNQHSRSPTLNDALNKLFITTAELNVSLHLPYTPTHELGRRILPTTLNHR